MYRGSMSTVFVGLSGGVDSAVSAALLREEGHEVTGVFIKIWQPEFTECTWREDRLDAMRVCAHLDIPYREIDLSEEYKKEVVADMIANYERGVTPNPDVLCNRAIKFGHFSRWAFAHGADRIATGHYARIGNANGRHELLRATDTAKDQSYFLYMLEESDLARTFFPVGRMTKHEVRMLARRYELPIAEKNDSQGLCFVGDVSIPVFLSRYIPLKKGRVVDANGSPVGDHEGAALYTIGQRHGFKYHHAERPHYVIATNPEKNEVVVSQRREDAARRSVPLVDVTWVGETPTLPFEADVQARYREKAVRAHITQTRVDFAVPHIAASGQSLVVYDGEKVLGGGIVGVQ